MKLAMAMSAAIGGPKVQIRQEKLEAISRRQRSEWLAQWRRRIQASVRFTFVFLLLTTIAVFVVAHRTQIDSVSVRHINVAEIHIKNLADESPLRQKALAYEKEVNEITP